MDHNSLLLPLTDHIISEFSNRSDWRLAYHNLNHTLEVVERALEIAHHYQLHDAERFVLQAAALFHDIGYLYSGPTDHEQESARKMREYFGATILATSVISHIEDLIIATKRIQAPISLLEKIICDADTYHLGTSDFKQSDPLVKKEVTAQTGEEPGNWIENSIKLLRDHSYYTDYCQHKLNEGKEKNIRWLESLLRD